jgi:hypothetical protein
LEDSLVRKYLAAASTKKHACTHVRVKICFASEGLATVVTRKRARALVDVEEYLVDEGFAAQRTAVTFVILARLSMYRSDMGI